MAKIQALPKLQLELSFTINEDEARALDALAGYGDDAFIDVFYKHLGKAYMQKHESGLREFLKSIRNVVSPSIAKMDEIRRFTWNK